MSTNRNLIREWKRIRARADQLHRLTGLAMYEKLVHDADQQLKKLAQPQRRGRGPHG